MKIKPSNLVICGGDAGLKEKCFGQNQNQKTKNQKPKSKKKKKADDSGERWNFDLKGGGILGGKIFKYSFAHKKGGSYFPFSFFSKIYR